MNKSNLDILRNGCANQYLQREAVETIIWYQKQYQYLWDTIRDKEKDITKLKQELANAQADLAFTRKHLTGYRYK